MEAEKLENEMREANEGGEEAKEGSQWSRRSGPAHLWPP